MLIRERQVGIVIKKFGARSLPPGRLLALAGEAGYQADTLAPGLHFGYFRWQYRILKVPVTVVPQGEIALVVAADGASIPAERILGKIVDCDNFQDARQFLVNGGEKGRQLGILTAGHVSHQPGAVHGDHLGDAPRSTRWNRPSFTCIGSSRTWWAL